MRYYLAGGISGVHDHEQQFHLAAKDLRGRGHMVISPVELDRERGTPNVERGDPEYASLLAQDIRIVADSLVNGVVVLPNWRESEGARLEAMVAHGLDKPLLEYPDLKPALPERHPASERFHAILRDLGALHDIKRQDYGSDDDPFANVRASTEWGIPGWVGAMVRANDKVRRLQTYARKGVLANEGAMDSFLDIAVYAVIAAVLYEETV